MTQSNCHNSTSNSIKSTTPLSDWLSWIEQLHPQEIDLGLERIKMVGERLGLLPIGSRVITVGGTNGKGSCVATLEAILEEAGYRVGAYFSPHLQRYNERIRIAGEFVSDEALCEAFYAINGAREAISLTYFEWGTLAALWLFKQAQLDIVVLEVGLGGRLDAVNIVDPDISVITTVDLDHTEWLGSDRESIGLEKAGIFRAGKPVVCGDLNPPKVIRETADLLQLPLYCQGIDFGYHLDETKKWRFWYRKALLPGSFSAGGRVESIDSVEITLPMPYFLPQNTATALMVIILLKEAMQITQEAISRGVLKAFLPGRFQVISKNPLVILDVAHNPQGCQQLNNRLKAMPCSGNTYAVVGMMGEKDHLESFKSLLAVVDNWFVANLDSQRGCSALVLVETLSFLKVKCVEQFPSILAAYQETLNRAQINDRIVVFGSFYAVAPILGLV